MAPLTSFQPSITFCCCCPTVRRDQGGAPSRCNAVSDPGTNKKTLHPIDVYTHPECRFRETYYLCAHPLNFRERNSLVICSNEERHLEMVPIIYLVREKDAFAMDLKLTFGTFADLDVLNSQHTKGLPLFFVLLFFLFFILC